MYAVRTQGAPMLALIRHGESQWNLENRFTGWVDVDLTARGEAEAAQAGALLRATGVPWRAAYTSVLKRAIRTLNIALDAMDLAWIPAAKDWRLNERHYGALTGLNKAETAERHGAAQVKIWRRSYDTPPPPLPQTSPLSPASDRRYRGVAVPAAESLKSTLERVAPLFAGDIAPRLEKGEDLLIAAHGNSIRALVKLMMAVSDEAIVDVEIPTGNPLLIDFRAGSLAIRSARYLDAGRATRLPPIP
jgi:2,3-bisphosphoglycerate-dependent phosphoglycerate mutase